MRRPDLGTQTGLNPKPRAGRGPERPGGRPGAAEAYGGWGWGCMRGLERSHSCWPSLLPQPGGSSFSVFPDLPPGQASGPSMCPEPGPVASGRPGFHGTLPKSCPPGLLEPSEVTILEASAAPGSSGDWKDTPPTSSTSLRTGCTPTPAPSPVSRASGFSLGPSVLHRIRAERGWERAL